MSTSIKEVVIYCVSDAFHSQKQQEYTNWILELNPRIREDDAESENELLGSLWESDFVGGGSGLNEHGYHIFYLLISKLLKRGSFRSKRLYRGARELDAYDKEDDAINDYIAYLYTYIPQGGKQTPYHSGALISWYGHWLVDILRRHANSPITVSIDDDEMEKNSFSWPDLSTEIDDTESLADLTEIAGKVEANWSNFKEWLIKNDADWELAMLRCRIGCSKELPLVRFEKKMGSTYNYHAKRLGIVPGGKQFPDYQCTIIGHWAFSFDGDCGSKTLPESCLNLPFDSENLSVVLQKLGELALKEDVGVQISACCRYDEIN